MKQTEKLETHKLWLNFKPGGENADFHGADLIGVDLHGVNLLNVIYNKRGEL